MLRVYLVGAIAGSVGHLAYCILLVPWLEVCGLQKEIEFFVNEHTLLMQTMHLTLMYCTRVLPMTTSITL
jgi:hypothetical protein